MVFENRAEAARALAKRLEHLRKEDPIILAIPRGGAVTGDIVATALGVKLDLVVPRKLGAPMQPELAIGAVMHNGSHVLNEEIVALLRVSREYINKEIAAQTREIERRLTIFRGGKEYPELKDRIVILVDDGIATGATMFAAVEWVRKQKPRKLVVAIPVGPAETVERLRLAADEVVVLMAPLLFGAVGEFYRDFGQVSDDEVVAIMRKHGMA